MIFGSIKSIAFSAAAALYNSSSADLYVDLYERLYLRADEDRFLEERLLGEGGIVGFLSW